MAAYLIISYDIVDAVRYQDYVPGVMPLLAKHGAEILVADRDARALEGEKRSVYVVLRFDSEETAETFYNDPEYEPVRKIRLDSTANGSIVLTSQFIPPAGSD